jgi:ribosomal-protein-alanine N-acetyltransferase
MDLQLESLRLLYRPFELSDAQALFEMDNNPNVHKYLWQKPTLDIDESIQIIEMLHKQYKENGIGRFATILKETGELIGWTGIKFVNDHIENGNTNFYDYGYRLNEKFWNKGYATEATKAWFDYGFNEMKIETLHAYTHAENGASNHILEKNGMQFMDEYTTADGINWKWWQLENVTYNNKSQNP